MTILVSACGGGDGGQPGGGGNPGGNTNPGTTTIEQGRFIDSAVQGLVYRTESQSGITDPNGVFEYVQGEEVEFELFGQVIGTARPGPILTPYNFNEAIDNEQIAINILRMLQTMDTDGDPLNGITLPVLAVTMNVNFDQTPADFGSDPAVLAFVADNSSATLVDENVAIANFVIGFEEVLNEPDGPFSGGIDLTQLGSTKSVFMISLCNNAMLHLDYTFSDTGVTVTGDDTFFSDPPSKDCEVGTGSGVEFDAYGTLPDSLFDCGPFCSYSSSELFKNIEGVDEDGRNYRFTVSHVFGTDVWVATKTILSDPDIGAPVPYSFTEVVNLNTDGYTLNLAGIAAKSKIHMTPCPDNVLGELDYQFGTTDIFISGTDSFQSSTDPVTGALTCTVDSTPVSFSEPYVNMAEIGLECGPVCTFDDLNRSVRGLTDDDGRTFNMFISHRKGSRIINVIRRYTADPSVPAGEFSPYSFEEEIKFIGFPSS